MTTNNMMEYDLTCKRVEKLSTSKRFRIGFLIRVGKRGGGKSPFEVKSTSEKSKIL